MDALDLSMLDGISHHLYHGVDENDPYASTDFAKVGKYHPELPHFQTEYSRGDWFSLAGLIYKSFHDEEVQAYFYWDLIWGESGGLITLEFPWDASRWTDPTRGYIINREYYAFKQFSGFIHPGWKRNHLTLSGPAGAALAFVNPTADSAACVVINRSLTDSLAVRLGLPGYRIVESGIYTTSETDECLFRGALTDSLLVLAPRSVATVELRIVSYDPAEDTIAPTVPMNLRLTGRTPTSLSVAWQPSEDSIGVKGYHIYLDGELEGSSTDTSYSLLSLSPLTSYEINVSAYDDAGNESGLSGTLEATTPIQPDTIPPVLEVSDTVYDDGMGAIEVISSEPGVAYLVPQGTGSEIDLIRESALDTALLEADQPVLFGLAGLSNETYWVVASDTAMNLSAPHPVVVLGVGIGKHRQGSVGTYPNPFRESTTLRFSLEQPRHLKLLVVDSRGQQIRAEPLGDFAAGEHRVTFHRENLKEGFYLFRIEDSRGNGWSGRWLIRD